MRRSFYNWAYQKQQKVEALRDVPDEGLSFEEF
jgi:hypothetical protein